MSEQRRLRCLNIAAKAGATPDNIVKVAADLEKWVTQDEDPIRVGVPSPKAEIDWLGNDLVVSVIDPDFIVRVDGDFTENSFIGTVYKSGGQEWDFGSSGTWDKDKFRFYKKYTGAEIASGEIPAKQPEIDWDRPQLVRAKIKGHPIVRTSGAHAGLLFVGVKTCDAPDCDKQFFKEDYEYHGEIPAKTENLTFQEAMKAVFSGRKVRRAFWHKDVHYVASTNYINIVGTDGADEDERQPILGHEVFATDWQIIEQ